MAALTVGVLGPLLVDLDGRSVPLTMNRLRCLLVGLALSPERSVPVEQLTAIVWNGDLPAHPRRSLQTYVARLRAVLGADRIRTEPAGYALKVPADGVDALRFEGVLSESTRTPDVARERALLDKALGLWRGEPFQGVDSEWLTRTEYPRLLERHLAAVERLVDIDLEDGRYHESLLAVEGLIARHPLRESLWLRLLKALHRLGRPAEALQRYEQVRRRIAEELGVDPSAELQKAYTDLLNGGRGVFTVGFGSGPGSAEATSRQLPRLNLMDPRSSSSSAGTLRPLCETSCLR
ncbi:BTAD domain-containing putative transcriptional regulator [Micromonospora sp. WMMD1155]|uniref:AfsR/SARP family transcriptional regulator n=1 Tax=Micromonospora sp. WMMD1155 TaxID=3016094 RepID=UPI00249B629E|nr:BTAD domain-containing putative transcriptional regulator [Micromonospora sp. WMMD1155]WFE53325.1 BTAD domain-containing putative transcriptional regulator [Micromonospora sp. WMMD1155]